MSEKTKDLLALKNEIIAGDKAQIEAQKNAGKLTARERIAKLFDDGSFVEIGALVKSEGDLGEGVVAGFGTIDARPVYVYAQDYTVKRGAVSVLQAKKITRVTALAQKTGAPVVALLDSAGAKIEEGAQVLDAYADIIAAHAKLSGVVPQIAVVAGPCVGSCAIAASLCDFVIMSEKVSALLAQGAQILSAKTGKDITPQDLGGAAAAAKAGACAYAATNEDEAIAAAKKILSCLPSNNMEDAPAYDGEDLNRAISSDGYDVAHFVSAIADGNDSVELYKGYAPALYTGLVKIGGYCAGVVANNPAVNEGVITVEAAAKAARLIGICDSFNIPVLSIINTKGFEIDEPQANFASLQAGAKLAYAYAEATVPKVSLITGKAIGGGYAVMGSKGVGADLVYAWPGALIAPLNPDAGARILYNDEIKAGLSLAEAEAEYAREAACPFKAAATGMIDDVIAPEATRQYLISAVDMLYSKRESVLARKHGNQPL